MFFTVIVGPASFIYLYTLLTISLDCEYNTFPLNLLRVGGMLKEIVMPQSSLVRVRSQNCNSACHYLRTPPTIGAV
jgi:hypothetical protein